MMRVWALATALPLAAQLRLQPAWDQRPVIRLGEKSRIEFRSRTQYDFGPERAAPDFSRARLGIEGRLGKDWEFQLEAEATDREAPLRDAYLLFRRWKKLQIQTGRMKIPFGRDRLTPVHQLDFIARSRAGDYLSPGRGTGILVQGKLAGKRWNYEAGLFGSEDERPGPTAPTAAGRLLYRFFDHKKSQSRLEAGLSLGAARLPEGRASFRARDLLNEPFFRRLNASGNRRRLGLEAEYRRGPWRFDGEIIRARDTRLGQSLMAEDLLPLLARGGWAAAHYRIAKRWESNLRWESLRFSGGDPSWEPASSPRAENIAPAQNRLWTAGLTFSPQRHLRLQFNLTRESLLTLENQRTLWRPSLRLGVVF